MKVRFICAITIFLSLILIITGCTQPPPTEEGLAIEGFIIEKEERILVAEGITSEKFIEIKDRTLQELDKERISLIYLSYEDNNQDLKVGDKVKVWIDGGIDDSYPAQAKAKKFEVQK